MHFLFSTLLTKVKSLFYPLFVFLSLGRVKLDSLSAYHKRNYGVPSPKYVKELVLLRWGGQATWIETGTAFGETTKILAENSSYVFSIEPSKLLHETALKKLLGLPNVSLIFGTSEEKFGSLLSNLIDNATLDISFWLDGHFSHGSTYLGKNETSIVSELAEISKVASKISKITVLVDDVRCFRPTQPQWGNYPDLNFLVDWANSLGLFWTIEHDIFIATNRDISLT